jgi:hypothetical protein
LITYDYRYSGEKNVANDTRKTKCLKAGLILAGISMALMCLTGMIVSIYLLVIMSKTTTTTATATATATTAGKK